MAQQQHHYQILLDPSLGIPADALAAAWEEIEDCNAAGDCLAGDTAAKRESFAIDPGSAAIGALLACGAAVAKDLIVILVKRALERADESRGRRQAEAFEVSTVEDAETGLPLIRVTQRSK